MSRLGRIVLLTVLTVAATLAWAAPASAIFHLVKIREVSPETSEPANDAFIELQMYFAGQNSVSAHTIRIHNAAGTMVTQRILSGPDPASGQSQRTILIGDTGVPGRDFTINGLSDGPSGTIPLDDGAGGAVCFDETLIDCVSWGSFNNAGSMADIPVGTNAPAIPAGSSLTRSIARGCATLLENGDDTDNSAADFSVTARSPRPNSTAPPETACAPPADTQRPNTIIRSLHVNSGLRRARVRFRGTDNRPGPITFQCAIDGSLFAGCRSPKVYRRLAYGRHRLRIRARDAAGNYDRTPARRIFHVLRPSARR
jgi:hypothetical protein